MAMSDGKRASIGALGLVLLLAAGVAIGQNIGQNTGQNTDQSVGQGTGESSGDSAAASACARSVIYSYPVFNRRGEHMRDAPIWQVPGSDAFFFVAGMTIDADGSPNAYHPDNIGLDDLRNAGEPGHWDGIITDGNGEPLTQGPDDPFPGYYVSCTSLSDRSKRPSDPTRYVDASKIPYVVLPREVAEQGGAQLGDFAFVINLRNGKSSYAIFADVGTLGEGSIALADNLGIASDARRGGSRGRILYLLFPKSGNRQPRTVEEIYSETDKLLQNWGGTSKATACSDEEPLAAGTPGATAKPTSEGQASAASN